MKRHAIARSRLLALTGVCGALGGAPLLVSLAQAGPAAASPSIASTATSDGGGTGGTGFGGGTKGSSGVTNVDVTVSASGSGMKFSTTEGEATGHKLTFRGNAPSSDRGRWVELQATPNGSSAWKNEAKAQIGSKSGFAGGWTPSLSGRFLLRTVLLATNASTDTPAAGTARTGDLGVMVFKHSEATWYGPGFWGNKTACGQTLKKTTLGVASRTLKCGTKVAINYRDRVIVVPVIDRGPYGTAADWDLTEATAHKLGMAGTSTVGTIVNPS